MDFQFGDAAHSGDAPEEARHTVALRAVECARQHLADRPWRPVAAEVRLGRLLAETLDAAPERQDVAGLPRTPRLLQSLQRLTHIGAVLHTVLDDIDHRAVDNQLLRALEATAALCTTFREPAEELEAVLRERTTAPAATDPHIVERAWRPLAHPLRREVHRAFQVLAILRHGVLAALQ